MKYINRKEYYFDEFGNNRDANNIAYWSEERKLKEQFEYFQSKPQEELIETIKLDYLLGVATLLGDFSKNISTLIEERNISSGDDKVKVAEKLLSLLFPSVKDPKQLSIPSLDIDKMIEALTKQTKDSI